MERVESEQLEGLPGSNWIVRSELQDFSIVANDPHIRVGQGTKENLLLDPSEVGWGWIFDEYVTVRTRFGLPINNVIWIASHRL